MNTKQIVELHEESFQSEVLQHPGPVLVDFYAPWCGPCKMLTPLLEQLAGHFAGQVKFTKLNVDNALGISARYQITGVPTLMIFRDGEVAGQMVGLGSPKQLHAWLENACTVSSAARQ